ncbi:MAG: hypothetical protein KME32_30840 [Mojavia pulchra JT2-VF2]|jgi:hypothetical protein|uniref:Uncharacterized protein n=1 Tax=Mojavia pulchra JT2-VF2 TaxID=287848 RepID=A0A951Q453_9NOST|nr:hypothetical protein [Mojavia pulchra JT2-VF2]
MGSTTLRLLWSVIEETQTSILLGLNDTELIKQILAQINNKQLLSGEEIDSVRAYIYARTPLIRDLAQARIA